MPRHSGLKEAGLFRENKVILAVATTSPNYRTQVTPSPICMDLALPEMCHNMINRLVQRLGDSALPAMTFLVPPRVIKAED